MTEQFYTVVFNDGTEQLFPYELKVGGLVIFHPSLSIRKVVDKSGATKMLNEVKKAINYANEKTHIKDRVVIYTPEFSEREGDEAAKFFNIDNYKIIPVNVSY